MFVVSVSFSVAVRFSDGLSGDLYNMPRKKTKTPFAKILCSLMEEQGVGVRQAAKMAGVSPSTITDWRSGTNPDDYLAVRKLAEKMGTTMSFLLTGEHDKGQGASTPSVTEVFEDGDLLFDGFAKITIQRLVPRTDKDTE